MINKLIRLLKNPEKYQVKDLYVGEILCFYAEIYKKPKNIDLTMRAKKSAILTPVDLKNLSFKHIKENLILRPLDSTPVGHYVLNEKSLTPLKDAYPEILEKLKLIENSKLTKAKIIKLEDYLNTFRLYSTELKL